MYLACVSFKKLSKHKFFLTIIEVKFWKSAIAQLSKGSTHKKLDYPTSQGNSSSPLGMPMLPAGSLKTASLKRGSCQLLGYLHVKNWKEEKISQSCHSMLRLQATQKKRWLTFDFKFKKISIKQAIFINEILSFQVKAHTHTKKCFFHCFFNVI